MSNAYENSLNNLLKAEEEANAIISQAEENRDRLKLEAQTKAKEEIKKLRDDMEREFQAKRGDSGKEEDDRRLVTKASAKVNEEEYEANKGKVIQLMVERIMAVHYEVPRNVKANFHILRSEHV
jgi:V-type H+-transporting ATPase subunit G